MWVIWWLFFLCPVGPGFHPSVRHQLSFQEDPEQWAVETSYSLTHGAETMAKFKGIGKKYNLMAQVIPLYGFGIFLYIFYIIYKVGHSLDGRLPEFKPLNLVYIFKWINMLQYKWYKLSFIRNTRTAVTDEGGNACNCVDHATVLRLQLTCKGRAAKSGKCTTATNPTCKLCKCPST